MEKSEAVKAEAGVLFRSSLFAAVAYGVYLFFGPGLGGFDVADYLLLTAVLFAVANGLFWGLKWYRPDMLAQAEALEAAANEAAAPEDRDREGGPK